MSRRLTLRGTITLLVKLAVVGAFVALLVGRINLPALGQVLLGANIGAVVVALAGLLLTVSLNGLRWRLIVRQLGGQVSKRTAVAGTFEGMFFNLFLPTSVGGDAARAYRAYDTGVPAGLAVTSGLADRAVGLASVMALLLVASLVAPGISTVPSFGLVTAFSAVGLIAAIALAAVGKILSPRQLWTPVRLIAKGLDAFAAVIFSRSLLTGVLPLTIVANLINCSVLWSCAQSVGLHVTFLDAVVVLEASSLAAILPISFGGWGVREGATAVIFGAMGNPMTSSVAASILYAGVLVAIGCVGAGVWFANPYRRKLEFKLLRSRGSDGATSAMDGTAGTTAERSNTREPRASQDPNAGERVLPLA